MPADVADVGLVVEGQIDRFAAECLLKARGLTVDPHRIVVTQGGIK